MQNGFNIKNNYYARYPKDEQRKFRFEVKLNIANEEKFPFIIVGFEEFNDTVNSSLMIVDGIIGIITANQKLMKLKEDFNPDILGYSSEYFNDYDYETQAFIRYEWLNLIRLQSSFDNNPILKRCNELYLKYSKYIDSYSVIYIDHNDKKEICLEWMFDYVENAKYIDAKCVIKLLNFKDICKTVSLANIKTSSCRVYCLPDKFRYFHDYCDETAARDCCLVSNIARLLAFEELEKYISAADA
ncbi:hypothetical protein AMR41_07955 [Hapalosiphon sp. MRB220]|nr:hypothetical protein AMR41_07955 [Hapalosiphon sp. MRB220]